MVASPATAALRRLDSAADALAWLDARGARALATDSRRVRPGDAFIAWPGYAVDGRAFVPQALAAGASACLVEADGAPAFENAAEPVDAAAIAALAGLKAATGSIASEFMGRPSERLEVVAVTGTNGKTSVTWWVAQALGALGRRCGVIGTLGIGEPPHGRATGSEPPHGCATGSEPPHGRATGSEPQNLRATGAEPPAGDGAASGVAPGVAALTFTGMTTPDPVTVQAGFRRFADAGLAACAIEATSIGLAEHRLDGSAIDVAVFTNFTQDHLDYHRSMDAYWDAKARLFAWPGLRAAVVNVDDAQGARLARSLQDTAIELWTYSTRGDARLCASAIGYADGGLGFEVGEGSERVAVRTRLIGDYNVANLLATIGALRAGGVPLADAAAACAGLTPVPGRMQRVDVGPSDAADRARPPAAVAPGSGRPDARAPLEAAALPQVVVDYAHTPDALDKALAALRPFAAERGGALWCVFGCGGNRDAAKRPLMGAIAQRLADRVVLTSDNPRLEPPAFILLQIVAGLNVPPGHRDAASAPQGGRESLGRPGASSGSQERVTVIEDRQRAIAHAVRHAAANDVILVAGKGHEDYQDIGGTKRPFSDADEAAAALRARTEAAR